jgi:3'-phosphoadenosine 5'-phosphosulfate sulfotransferase (PAPS reductase)/FAD synthetase
MNFKVVIGTVAMLFGSLVSQAQSDWQQKVKQELPLLGHRNWIVIVDSAYPLQTSSGVETVETGTDQLAVVDYVLEAINNSKHVRPLVHTDTELKFVPEKEAPGVERYREALKARLNGLPTDSIPHVKLIERLNETGKDFHVLVLKTNMTIPYTSVFLQLDCRYWGAESEARLQDAIKAAEQHKAGSKNP